MATDRLRIIVDEVLVTIKQTFDDKIVSQAQAAQWVIFVGNRLLSQHISKRDSGQFLNIFVDVPVSVATTSSNPNIVKGRKYVELPANIFDFNMDSGVEYIAYYNPDENCSPEAYKKTIQRTSPSDLQWLNLNDLTKPSPKAPYWYRAGDYLYIVGIESVPVKFLEMGVYMTINPLEEIDIDQPFNFPQELLEVLKRQVVDLARFSFLFPGNDRSNDGDDTASDNSRPVGKTQSVNDPNAAQ